MANQNNKTSNNNRNSAESNQAPAEKNFKPYNGKKKNKKNYYKGGNNKGGRDRRDYTPNAERTSYDAYRSNDISWWNKSPLYKDATAVPFNRIYGAGVKQSSTLGQGVFTTPISGVMAFDFIPTIGTSYNNDSAVNRTFTTLFSTLYSKTTGTPPIQKMDVAMYITSLASIAAMIGSFKRVLGVAQIYNSLNYNFPNTVIRACGYNPGSSVNERNNLRRDLNDLILAFNSMKVPDIMDIFARQYSLSHNIYADEDSVTAAMTVFRPIGFYEYVDTEFKCKFVDLTGQLNTGAYPLKTAIGLVRSALNKWRNSDDMPLITGTIQRAFKDTSTSFVTLDYVFETDVSIPVYDRNMNWQINNLNIVDIDKTTIDITQNVTDNYIVMHPTLASDTAEESTAVTALSNFLLNSYDGNTSDEFVMEATRLLTYFDDESNLLIMPTECVTKMSIFSAESANAAQTSTQAFAITNSAIKLDKTANAASWTKIFKILQALSQFKIHPYVKIIVYDGEDIINNVGNIGDIFAFTTVSVDGLNGLTLAATQSAFGLIL